MENVARNAKPGASKRIDNVIGLFPGMVPGFSQKNSTVSLLVSAARLELACFEERLAMMGIHLSVSDETLAEIAKAGIDSRYGARPLQRTIEMEIEYPLSKAVIQGKFVAKDTIKVRLEGGVIAFEK